MPSTDTLLKAYGNIPIPGRVDEMTYQEAIERDCMDSYLVRQALMRLWERDVKTMADTTLY